MKPTIERARNYIARMPPSISGSGGHTALYNVAVVLTRGFSFSEADAFPPLAEWNESNALPPWSEPELRYKLKSASSSNREIGFLLRDGEKHWHPPHPAEPESAAEWQRREEKRKKEQRDGWPKFHALSARSVTEIATLRRLPALAVDLLRSKGLLWGAQVDGKKCFVIKEGIFAQARRFDGQHFSLVGGSKKTKTLPGSQARFVGRPLLGECNGPVLLVEGVIGILEGIAALLAVDADMKGWTVLAAVSASSRFEKEPDLLAALRGRIVTIIQDNDEAGVVAALTWDAELRATGASSRIYELPPECKDIGDLVADSVKYAPELREIFTL